MVIPKLTCVPSEDAQATPSCTLSGEHPDTQNPLHGAHFPATGSGNLNYLLASGTTSYTASGAACHGDQAP